MFFTQKVNIKILLIIFFGSCLVTGYSYITAIPALENGDDKDFLLALLFRMPTKGYSWDYFYHMSASEIARQLSWIFLISIIMERMISYMKFINREENEEGNS